MGCRTDGPRARIGDWRIFSNGRSVVKVAELSGHFKVMGFLDDSLPFDETMLKETGGRKLWGNRPVIVT